MMESMLPKRENMAESFARLVDDIYIRHNGCLITKELIGFSWGGEHFDTAEEAKSYIDNIKINNIQPPLDYHKTHISLTVVNKDGSEKEIEDNHKEKYLTGNSAYNSFKSKGNE